MKHLESRELDRLPQPYKSEHRFVACYVSEGFVLEEITFVCLVGVQITFHWFLRIDHQLHEVHSFLEKVTDEKIK